MLRFSKYNILYKSEEQFYVYNQLMHSLVRLPPNQFDAIEHHQMANIQKDIITILIEKGIVYNDISNEEDSVICNNLRLRYQSKTLRITIMPTQACNFSCWYCYERHYASKMNDKDIAAIYKFIINEVERKQLKRVILDWFGGEPLLYFDQVIYPLSLKIKKWTANNSIRFSNMITTNGSLITQQMANRMKQIGLSCFQITLDGSKKQHNAVRYSNSMRDSYSVIVRNIHLLCRTLDRPRISVRINYTQNNILDLIRILDDFEPSVRHFLTISPHVVWQEARMLKEGKEQIDELKKTSQQKGYNIDPSIKNSHNCITCYTENMEQFLINYDLSVYKCTARNFDGSRSIGHISQAGEFVPNALFQKYFAIQSPILDKDCSVCELLPSCLSKNNCIQKKMEGITKICDKESIRKAIMEHIHVLIQQKGKLLLCIFLLSSLWTFAQTNANKPFQNTGIIEYTDTIIGLAEVEVMAKYIEQEHDGQINVRVHGNPLAAGQTMENFVRGIPTLSFEANELSVGGRKGTILELDGNTINIEEFKSLPLEMISRLEIIPNAEVQYGPTATGGILRVVMRETVGFIGGISYENLTDEHGMVMNKVSNATQMRLDRLSAYNHLQCRDYDKDLQQLCTDYAPSYQGRKHIHQTQAQAEYSDRLFMKYSLSKQTKLQALGFLTIRNEKDKNVTNMILVDNTSRVQETLLKTKYKGYGIGTRLDHNFGDDRAERSSKFFWEFKFKGNDTDVDEQYGNSNFTTRQTLSTYFMNSCMTLNFPFSQSVDAGLMLAYLNDRDSRISENSSSFGMITPLKFKRTCLEFRPVISYRLGLRKVTFNATAYYYMQRTKYIDYFSPSRNFVYKRGAWHPRLSILWNINSVQRHTVEISYRHSFNFANFNYYIPSTQYISQNFYSTGNPFLKEEVHNILEVTYNYNTNFYVISQVQRVDGAINIITRRNAYVPNLYYTQPENSGRRLNLNMNCGINGFLIKNVWHSNLNVIMQYRHSRAPIDNGNFHSWLGTVNCHNTFSITPTFGLLLMLNGHTKYRDAGCEYGAEFHVSPGLYATILKKHMVINVAVDNLFCNKASLIYQGENSRFIRKDTTSPTMLQVSLTWNFHFGRNVHYDRFDEMQDVQRVMPQL
ncbi:MAG: outer membrane beta-barrel protein [Bacteroidaceae bacterium]|nr:outer membrane beta-barrel protein [Bacteroidaceae bacterium]